MFHRVLKVHVGLIASALVAALTPISPRLVERWYSLGLFPRLQPILTWISNRSGIAFLDVLILLAVLWLVTGVTKLAMRRAVSGATSNRAGVVTALRWGVRIAGVASACYLAFLLAWGMNYRRTPLTERLSFDPARLTGDRARLLALKSTSQLNALYEPARALATADAYTFDPRLAEAFRAAAGQFGVPAPAVLPRPKWSLLDIYFRRSAVAGMTDPFFLEALLASDLLPVERPFVTAHEWAHAAGLADEGEAGFAGWLTCLKGTAGHQYSGWLFAYSEIAASLDDGDRRAVASTLGAGPRADLTAIRERQRRNVSPGLSAAGWQVYDRYLKANGVTAGAASYSQVVRLMLGVTEIQNSEFGIRNSGIGIRDSESNSD